MRWRQVQHQVGVLTDLIGDLTTQGYEKELCPFATGELHCGHEVAVAGYQYDDFNLLLQSQRRDVQTYPHIDSLLMYVWAQVVCRDSKLRSSVREPLHVQGPASKAEVSHSERHEWHVTKFFVQQLVVAGKFRIAERYASTCERFPLSGCEGRGVVEVDTVKVEPSEFRVSRKSLDEVTRCLSREGMLTRPQLSFQKSRIDQWRSFVDAWGGPERKSAATARGAEALLDCSARRG